MGIMDRASERWDQRRAMTTYGATLQNTKLVTVHLSEQVTVAAPASEVWSFLSDPRSWTLMSDVAIASFYIPGTPIDAIGERTVNVQQYGDLIFGLVSELVEYEAGRRDVWKSLSAPGKPLTTQEVLPIDGATCVFRVSTEQSVQSAERKVLETEQVAKLVALTQRVREIVEAKHRE